MLSFLDYLGVPLLLRALRVLPVRVGRVLQYILLRRKENVMDGDIKRVGCI